MKRVVELVVELCDPSGLLSLGLTHKREGTSDTRLIHLLTRGVQFFGALLTDLISTSGNSFLMLPESAVSSAAAGGAASAAAAPPTAALAQCSSSAALRAASPLSSPVAWQQHVAHLRTCQVQRELWARGLAHNSSSYEGGVQEMRAALVEARLAATIQRDLPATADCAVWQLQCHLLDVGAPLISGTKEVLLARLQPAALDAALEQDAASAQARAEAEALAQRQRRVLDTPLFGTLNVRSLPLGYRTQRTPLLLLRGCCRADCPWLDAEPGCYSIVTMACGCRYHSLCLPASGVCEPCRAWLVAELKRNSAVREGTVAGVANDLASDTLAAERDADDAAEEEDDDGDCSGAQDGGAGARATASELKAISEAVEVFRTLSRCIKK